MSCTPIKGTGHGPLCPLAMPVPVVQPAGFVNGRPKRGSEAPERGEGVGGGYPSSHGREIFENLCMKTAFSRTLNAIGVVYVVAQTSSLLFSFSF